MDGSPGTFGPIMETVLSEPELKGSTEASVEMFDLESGRRLVQPSIDYFDSRVDLIKGWIRSNSLDISCLVWKNGATCVTYDMTIVPVESKCWEQTTEQELLDNPDVAPVTHSPRKLLILGDNKPNTYIFRTSEGTLGMLRIVGVAKGRQGVTIRYKLLNPPYPEVTKTIAAKSGQS